MSGGDQEGRLILDAFRANITNIIEDEMLAFVKPRIRALAEQAVKELEPQVQAAFDLNTRDFLVRVSMNIQGDKP